jgi:hypothetical protein
MSKLCATLDVSRGLRMDKPNNQTSPPASHNGIDSTDGSACVYCGDAAQVREGFAIALRLMGMMHVDAGSEPDNSQSGG